MIIKIPETLQKEIDRYFELRIGTQLVPCPYYINSKISSGNLRVMSGKGEADEIELEVRIWAKLKGLDLEQADVSQIRKFMQKLHIGIDCSGFIANVFDNYLVILGATETSQVFFRYFPKAYDLLSFSNYNYLIGTQNNLDKITVYKPRYSIIQSIFQRNVKGKTLASTL